MTTIAQTWGYTCRICDNVTSFIGGIFTSFYNAMIVSRQIEANTRLARFMRHEYPGLSDVQILSELNYKTIRRVYDE